MAEQVTAGTMLRNLSLLLPVSLQSGCEKLSGRRTALQQVIVDQCLFALACVERVLRNISEDEVDQLTIGFIGCGLLGRGILDAILARGFQASKIFVSTRSPHLLTKYSDLGILVTHDNAQIAKAVRLLFVSVLPAQLPAVAAELSGNIRRRCLVCCNVAGVDGGKLRRLFGVTSLFHTATNPFLLNFSDIDLELKMQTYGEEADTDGGDGGDLDLRPQQEAPASAMSSARDGEVKRTDAAGDALSRVPSPVMEDEVEEEKLQVKDDIDGTVAAAVLEAETHMAEAGLTSDLVQQSVATVDPWADLKFDDRRMSHVSVVNDNPDAVELRRRARISALHCCRQEEQLRRLFIVVAHFALRCGVPREFAQILASQVVLGIDVKDLADLKERSAKKRRDGQRRKSGLGPMIEQSMVVDAETAEFALAGYIVEGRLPAFWDRFVAVVADKKA